jgi:hypothetical protein
VTGSYLRDIAATVTQQQATFELSYTPPFGFQPKGWVMLQSRTRVRATVYKTVVGSMEQTSGLGKIWERTQGLKTSAKSHRINGP